MYELFISTLSKNLLLSAVQRQFNRRIDDMSAGLSFQVQVTFHFSDKISVFHDKRQEFSIGPTFN